MELHSKKISPNTGILLKGVLIPKLLYIPFASCFLINLDFLLLDIAHFDIIISLPLLVLDTWGFTFFVYFLHLKSMIPFLYLCIIHIIIQNCIIISFKIIW